MSLNINATTNIMHTLQNLEFDQYNGKDVLEIGCGMGIDLLQYAKGGANVTGIDLTEKAVKIVKHTLPIET